MRVGVVGCGYWGAKHVRVLSSLPSVDLVVAIDRVRDRTRALQRSFPGVLAVDSVEEALDFVDAAVVATPPLTHAAVAATLLSAGKHVLVEKPMAASSEEALRLIDLAERNGRLLMAGHTFEYNAAVHYLRSLVSSGELGSIYYLDAARLNLGLYQSDVNAVWDLAPHDVSILNYVLQAEPTRVQAWGDRHAQPAFEDVGYIRLEYETVGVSAQVHVSWLDPCKVRRVTVVGSQRMAVYNDLAADESIRIYDKGVQLPTDPTALPMTYWHGDIRMPRIDFCEPLAAEDAHFVDAANGLVACLTDGWRGLAVVRVLEAATESLRTGHAVALAPTAGLVPAPRGLVDELSASGHAR